MKHLVICFFICSLVSCNTIVKESEALLINNKGLEYYNEGNYELAINHFKRAANTISISNDSRSTYFRNISVVFREIGNDDSCRHYSLKAANLHPQHGEIYLINMAEVDIIDGKIDQAIVKIKQAIEKGGGSLETYNTLGLIYYGEYGSEYMDLDKAIFYNEKAYELKRDRITEDLLARTYYNAEKLDKAEIHFIRLNKNFPEMLDYTYHLGMIKYKQDSLFKAKLILNELVQKDSVYYFLVKHVLEEEHEE